MLKLKIKIVFKPLSPPIMKSSKEKDLLNLEDSNRVARFLDRLGRGEVSDTLVLTRGHIRAVTLDAQPDGTVHLDAKQMPNGRTIRNVISARLREGIIVRSVKGNLFRVFQSNSSVPPHSSSVPPSPR